jgi:hypothetical protein
MILMMCGHHLFIYPPLINIFNILNAECETEWSTSRCVMGLIILRKTLYETLGLTRMNNVSQYGLCQKEEKEIH